MPEEVEGGLREMPEAPPTSQQPPAEDISTWPTGRLLSTAARLVEHAWIAELERRGLTHAGLIVLHILTTGPRSQTDLARLARVENQTMSRTLDRLQRQNFVERMPDPSDRRRHVVSITRSGDEAWASTRTLERDLMPDVGDASAFRTALLDIISSSALERWNTGKTASAAQ
ncbi:MarR family winged helix-turn-helix transcriptional regulator [Subtercola endophyticus]|uniref:MarR family winged helix-turn-helix transcriptional regulator n=1 Tax=Subtercola endophyticus TaxID=2895559 RepID=UPI001E2AE8FA|nr:MarR family transcriptional regulator [Subtercola endophyticus]UFS58999.1 MarR family transcriptional regulator [Subtercola endophyticus]